jgi:hypothetical protein
VYDVARERREDIWDLARLRAPVADRRKRFLYALALAGAWCHRRARDVLADLDSLARTCFVDGEAYAGVEARMQVESILVRMKVAYSRVPAAVRLLERYTPKNSYFVELLDIRRDEMVRLRQLIDAEEKRQRHVRRSRKRRRNLGAVSRQDYVDAEHEKGRQQAAIVWEFRKQGLSIRRIAEKTGYSKSWVQVLLATYPDAGE